MTVSGPDSNGVYTLSVMNIKQIDITLLKQWYAVPNKAPVQVKLYRTYDGNQGAPELCGTYTLDEGRNWFAAAEDLPAHLIADGTVKALKYYIEEDGMITDSAGQTVVSATELGLLAPRYKAVSANGTLPDLTINDYNSMSSSAANETLSDSGTLVVGNSAEHGQFAVNKTWYQLNSGYGWDNITGTIDNLYITGELNRIVTYTVGSETRTAEQKVATVKYSNAGVISCESETGESISGTAETSWLLKFQETGVGNDGHPQVPIKGLWTENGITYPAVYTYSFRETKLEEKTGENTWLDVTNRWFRAYKDNDAHTARIDLYNYRKSDLTIQKKWFPGASYGDGIQAVFFTVTNDAGENVGELAYDNPALYGLTSGDVARITVNSNEYYVVKLSPGTNGWTGNEAVVIDGLTTSRPLVNDTGEISADSWPEVQYTVTEVAYADANGTHAISELTRPMYQSQVRRYNEGAWRDDGTTPPAVQLGFNGDTKVRVNNTLAYDVNIFKTGDDAVHALANAKFELYGNDYYESDGVTVNTLTHPVKTNLISGSDGKIALGMLAEGTYYLLETQAPPGYNRLSKPVKLVVDPTSGLNKTVADGNTTTTYPLFVTYEYYLESGNQANLSNSHAGIAVRVNEGTGETTYSYTLTVPNSSGAVLPSTGGPGTKLIYFLGIMLSGIAGTGVVMRKRRRA